MKRLTPEEPTGQTAFRLPRALLKRLDKLTKRIGRDRGKVATRSEVVRALLTDSMNIIDMMGTASLAPSTIPKGAGLAGPPPEPRKPRKRKRGRK